MDFKATVNGALIYRVIGNRDTTEGRGPGYTIGYFLHEAAAKSTAKGSYVMGTDCPIESKRMDVVVLASGHMFLLGEEVDKREFIKSPEEIRKEALAKLTDEEKIVLGLK